MRFLIMGFAVLVSCPFQAIADSSDNLSQKNRVDDDAHVKLVSRDYAGLERQYGRYLDSYVTNKISEEELSLKFAVFSKGSGFESRYDEWVSAYPKSYSARLARGVYRVADAWNKRSTKFANETTDEQFRGFTETLELAASDLQASLELFPKPVESYRQLINASKGLKHDSARSLLDAALKLDPKAYYPRDAYLLTITPKWGGSELLMSKFIKQCKSSSMSDKNKAHIEGMQYYYLAEQAWWRKDYKTSSELYLKAYRFHNNPDWLEWSGRSAVDGGFKDMAFQRFDELIKLHPTYAYGFSYRGFLYETYVKNDEKAFKDYVVASNLGSDWAQNRVGWWYMTGKYVAKDFDKAEAYLRRSADQHNKTAIENLVNLDKLRKRPNSKAGPQ